MVKQIIDGVEIGVSNGSSSNVSAEDDGTYIIFKFNSSRMFKIRKSDFQFMVAGGYDADVTI